MASARRWASVAWLAGWRSARCTAARHAASSPGPASCSRPSVPARTSAAGSSSSASRAVRAPPASHGPIGAPARPCARPSSTAARHHDASASRAADTASRTARHLGRLLACPDDRRQLADERGARFGRGRQHAGPVAQHRVDERRRLGGPGAERRPLHPEIVEVREEQRATRGGGLRRRQRPERAEHDEADARVGIVHHRDAARLASDADERRRGSARRDGVLAHAGRRRPAAPTRSTRRRARRGRRASTARGPAPAATADVVAIARSGAIASARLPVDEQALRRAPPPQVGLSSARTRSASLAGPSAARAGRDAGASARTTR